MEVQRLYLYNPDKRRSLDVQGSVKTSLLLLDRMLVYLADHKPDILDEYISGLELKYKSAVMSSFNITDSLDLSNTSTEMKILMDFPDLLKTCADFLLTMLDVPQDYAWEPQELDLLTVNVTKASYHHFYYRAKLLTDLMDRDEAIQLLKEFIDFAIAKYAQVPTYEDLTSMYEDNIRESYENESADWIAIPVSEGRYISRGDKCGPYVVLKEFNDPELAYIVACYGDYALIKKRNENFVLTRTHTQMNGPYCDTCIHDTRIVDKIEHPPKEVFENL
ncbi:MAG: hypothetical protein JSW11_04985 [Candidatus Heimdallarchaeota archaeon]|nr:MAG: hypothetical protein JSW11_04985 [Candidatus Heimdallarchaeota archaeon]